MVAWMSCCALVARKGWQRKTKKNFDRTFLQMWPALIAKAKEGGLDVIQTYVFWNLHEPQIGQVFLSLSHLSLYIFSEF